MQCSQTFKDIAKVKPKEYEIIRHIGSGNFSCVFHVNFKDFQFERKHYALKKILKKDIKRLEKEPEALMEKHCLLKLHSEGLYTGEYDSRKYIAKLHYTFQDFDNLYFVMDYYSGDIWELIYGFGLMDSVLAKYYIAQLVNAVEFCHNHGIVHRDLKAENLLYSKDFLLKLIDFGSAMDLCRPDLQVSGTKTRGKKNITYKHFVGTPQFMAPEVVKNKYSGRLCDLWSLGCTIYQILVGIPPFQSPSDFLVHLRSKKLDLDFPPDFDPLAKDLIHSCLVVEPERRLGSYDMPPFSIASVKSHPYFDGIDFTQLNLLVKSRLPYPSLYDCCFTHISRNWYRFREKMIQAGWIDPQKKDLNMPFFFEQAENREINQEDIFWISPSRPVNLESHSRKLLEWKPPKCLVPDLFKSLSRVVYLKTLEESSTCRNWDSLVQEFLAEENHQDNSL